jgi:hypothetical protein
MTRTLYKVHRNGRIVVKYITTKHNCEVMLKEIIEMHHRVTDDVYVPSGFKVIRVIGKEKKVIYTPKNRAFWNTTFDIN